MQKERIALWDNTKFFLMILVAIGHLISLDTDGSHLYRGIYLFIWSFHMPLFIFISGLFHKNTNIKQKAVSYLSIYAVLKVLYLVIRMVTHQKLKFELFTEDGLPWFLFALAVFVVLTYLLRDFDKKYVLAIVILLSLFSGYDKNIGDFLVLSRIIVFYPFYFAGTMVSREKIESLAKRRSVKATAFALISAWGLICLFLTDKIYYIRPLLSGRNPFNSTLAEHGFLFRAGTSILAAVIGLCFILIMPTFRLGKITVFGQRTLQVYFWHDLIVKFAFNMGAFALFEESGYLKIIWALLGIPLTFILSLDIFKYPVNWLLNGAKKQENK